MSDVECPYCGKDQEINHDDGYGYEEDETHEQECRDCEKAFAFTTSISFHYDSSQADCLNGGVHKWLSTHTYPRACSRWRCDDCGQEEPMKEKYTALLEEGMSPKELKRGQL
jgi:hypothetical protein